MTEELADHRQALAEGERPRGVTVPEIMFASDTSIPGNASDYAVYRHTQRPRRDAMFQGGFVPASPCEERLTRQGYPCPRSD